MFDQIGEKKIFSKLYLWYGYHHIRIKEEYANKTTFRTRYGHYEFIVIPFGLTNAPTTFMCLMNSIFNKHLDKFVLIFIDDILIYSKSEDEHQKHLRIFLQNLRDHQLYTKFENVNSLKKDFERGITIDPHKIKAILYSPVPRDVVYIRYFMGLTDYYQSFI